MRFLFWKLPMMYSWWKRPLWQRVFAAFILGIIAGVIAGSSGSNIFKHIGDLYLNAVKMIVAPLIFFTITSSISQLFSSENVLRLGARTFFWFFATSALAVIVGIFFGNSMNPGEGSSNLVLTEVKPLMTPSMLDVLLGVIPSNFIKALAEGLVLQIIFFSSLLGAALGRLKDQTIAIRSFINEGAHVMFLLTRWVLELTPIGTFGLIAWVVSQYGLSSLLPLGKFIGTMYAACIFHIIFVYSTLLKLHRLKVRRFFKMVWPAQQIAFATSSSVATLPMSLRIAVEQLGVPKEIASFALPLGTTLKMDGCGAIFPVISAIFIAQYFGISISAMQYVMIFLTTIFGSFGTAGVPGSSMVMLTLTLSTIGLPLEGIGYIIAIDRLIDMIRTVVNVTGQILVPVIVAKEENILDIALYNGMASSNDASLISPKVS